jgi:hypothetical protein
LNAVDFLLRQHARLHSSAVAASEAPSLEDAQLNDLIEPEIRRRPPGLNSIAWLVWHMARAEDVVTNLVIAGRPQVLDTDWLERLRIGRRDIGTAMSSAEVDELSARVDLASLRAYRVAVGRRTREVIGALGAEDLDLTATEADVSRARKDGAFATGAEWVEGIWAGTTRGFLLGRNGIVHNAMHFAEIGIVRAALGKPGR